MAEESLTKQYFYSQYNYVTTALNIFVMVTLRIRRMCYNQTLSVVISGTTELANIMTLGTQYQRNVRCYEWPGR